MSVSPDEVLDPAHRKREGIKFTDHSKLKSQNQNNFSCWNGKSLANIEDKDDLKYCLPSKKTKKISINNGDNIGHNMEENRNSTSSSNSSASFGSFEDSSNGRSNNVSLNNSSYLPTVDANLSLEVINPNLDLDDDDTFGMPLSQQDEKLLEELLR